jgi:hypothetical protein
MNNTTQNQEEFESEIYRYCEIVYNMLQNNPELYEKLMPKSTFKLIAINDLAIGENTELKIAA